MSAYRAVLLALLVVGGSLAVAAPASATVGSVEPTEQRDAVAGDASAAADARPAAAQRTDAMAQNDTESNTSLGADISSFMQASAAEIGGAVETGMWSAAFNGTSDRSQRRRLVERRTAELRTELDDLQERKAELVAEREAGNVSEAAYRAQIGQLIGRIHALKSAINATEPRAREVGTNVDALQMLESDAQNLTGPELAAVARNTTGVGNASGPPDGVGNGSGPGAAAGPPGSANGNGPLEDAGNGTTPGVAGPPNGTEVGPPGNARNGPAGGLDNASGAGNGSDGPAGVPAGTPADGNGAESVVNASEQGPPADVPGRDAENPTADGFGPNATNPGTSAGDGPGGSGGPPGGVHLTTTSLAFGPITNAASAGTAAALRALALA